MWEYSNPMVGLATIASLPPSRLKAKSSKEPHPRDATVGAQEKQPQKRPVDIKKESRCYPVYCRYTWNLTWKCLFVSLQLLFAHT